MERDLLKEPDSTLADAANFHLVSASSLISSFIVLISFGFAGLTSYVPMLQALFATRGLHKQGPAYRQSLGKKTSEQARRIQSLEKELGNGWKKPKLPVRQPTQLQRSAAPT